MRIEEVRVARVVVHEEEDGLARDGADPLEEEVGPLLEHCVAGPCLLLIEVLERADRAC